MSPPTRDLFARWLPALVAVSALMANVLWLGNWSGRVDSRLDSLEKRDTALAEEIMPIEKRLAVFVSRAEWNERNAAREGETHDLKVSVALLVAKMDRLVEYQLAHPVPAPK